MLVGRDSVIVCLLLAAVFSVQQCQLPEPQRIPDMYYGGILYNFKYFITAVWRYIEDTY